MCVAASFEIRFQMRFIPGTSMTSNNCALLVIQRQSQWSVVFELLCYHLSRRAGVWVASDGSVCDSACNEPTACTLELGCAGTWVSWDPGVKGLSRSNFTTVCLGTYLCPHFTGEETKGQTGSHNLHPPTRNRQNRDSDLWPQASLPSR